MKDIIFQCLKCNHQVYLTNGESRLEVILTLECPNCGEEPYGNWRILRFGDYDKEIENKEE